jgi:hypothetical protein
MDFFTHQSDGGIVMQGSALCEADQSQVLRAYVHRYTGDHRPNWVDDKTPLHFKHDNEWLDNTYFAVNHHGRLRASVRDCYSRPTFPNHPEHRSKNPNPFQCGIHNVNP